MEIEANRRCNGAYASVFINDGKKLSWKVFKRRHDVSEEHVRNVFESEFKALVLAQSSKKLVSIVPNSPVVTDVSAIHLNGVNVSTAEFYPFMCIQMSALSGDFGLTKFGYKNDANAKEIKNEMRILGIEHFDDASYAVDENGNVISLVDFATLEHELQWDDM